MKEKTQNLKLKDYKELSEKLWFSLQAAEENCLKEYRGRIDAETMLESYKDKAHFWEAQATTIEIDRNRLKRNLEHYENEFGEMN